MKINGWLFVDKPEGISSRKVVDLISNSLFNPVVFISFISISTS